MKHITFLAAAAALFISLGAYAQNEKLIHYGDGPKDAINVISGQKTVVKEAGATYSFAIDFSQAHIVNFNREFSVEKDNGLVEDYNASKGADYVRDWPTDVKLLTQVACQKISKKLKVQYIPASESTGTRYDVVMKLAWFDLGAFVPIGGPKDGGNIAKGIMYVYDGGTENVIASFDVNYLRGRNIGYSGRERMIQFGGCIADAMKAMLK